MKLFKAVLIIFTLLLISNNFLLIANDSAKQDDPQSKKTWADFRQAKAEAEDAKQGGNLETITAKLLVVADISTALDRPDIAAWQYNNIAYYSIDEFKKKTDYANLMAKIEGSMDKKEKSDLIESAKKTLKGNISLLEKAKEYLEKAKGLDDSVSADKKDESRTNAISNNLNYVEWVQKFIAD